MWITQGHEYRAKQREAKQADEKLAGNSGSDIEEVAPPNDFHGDSFGEDEPEEILCPSKDSVKHTISLPFYLCIFLDLMNSIFFGSFQWGALGHPCPWG